MHPKWVSLVTLLWVMPWVSSNWLAAALCFCPRLPVIQSLAAEVKQTTQSLLSQLLLKLKSNIQVIMPIWYWAYLASPGYLCMDLTFWIWFYPFPWQLPECLRIIGYLRRIGVFSEYEMRLQVKLVLHISQEEDQFTLHLDLSWGLKFHKGHVSLLVKLRRWDIVVLLILFCLSDNLLVSHISLSLLSFFLVFQFLRCREAWLTGILEDLDQRSPYEYLKGMINCHRMHLFDVVNQYRAIFADDTSGSEENYDGGLLFNWAMHQITSHLKTLKIMLPKITEGGSLSNILDQCMVRYMIVWFYTYGFIFFFVDNSLTYLCSLPRKICNTKICSWVANSSSLLFLMILYR